jgi:hypothetical protein
MLLKKHLFLSFNIGCMLFFTACGVSIQAQRMSAVKKVAVIGYSARLSQEQKQDIVSMANTLNSLANDDKTPAEKQASLAYGLLVNTLSKHLQCTVLSEEEVANNATYRALWEKVSQKGFSGFATAMSKLDKDYHLEHILWDYRADALSYEDKKNLIQALGVDAVVVAKTDVSASSSLSIGSFNSSDFKGTTSLKMFDAVDPTPVWKDPYAKGAASESASTFTLMGVDLGDDKAEYFLQAIQHSFNKLISRYKKASSK